MLDANETESPDPKVQENGSPIEEKKKLFDLENLHPEARKRLQMLGLLKLNSEGEQEAAPDEEIDKILQKRLGKEDPDILADKYMMKHGLYELFKKLTTKIVLKRPADPLGFLANDLERELKTEKNN